MTPDIDIWRAANLLINQHGENAEIVAAQRADLMLERGDQDGRFVWLRIATGSRRVTGGSNRAGALKNAAIFSIRPRSSFVLADLNQLSQLVRKAPDGTEWLHEIKYAGYRMHARVDSGDVCGS